MRQRTWVFQVKAQLEKHGTEKASWHVGWLDPDGRRRQKSCGPGTRGRRIATNEAGKIHSQLVTGTYKAINRKTWDEFRKRYEANILAESDRSSREAALQSLNHFERLVKPKMMRGIDRQTIDDYKRKRKKEKGRINKQVSRATVNKELRYIRAALRVAVDYDFMDSVPKIAFEKTPEKLQTFVPPDHFAAIYDACEHAAYPDDVPNVNAADWWRALLITCYMTGWRITQVLSLQWKDIDLEAATAVSQAEDNKGRRDEIISFHPLIVDHLQRLNGSFDTHVFPWNRSERSLWRNFHGIQSKATITDADGNEQPMPKCGKEGWYGFHDLRRGFATQNAAQMDLFELQKLMQHRSLETTKLYVSMANRLNQTVEKLVVPEISQPKAIG